MAKNTKQTEMSLIMQEKITGKCFQKLRGKSALRTVSGNSSRNSSKSSYGNKISDEYDSEKDRGSDRY